VNDVTFVRVTLTIGGCDAVKEFVAYVMYSLASSFDFRDVTVGTTAESKVKIPLPIFLVEPVAAKDAGHFLAKVETDAARILGSFRPKEHDALMTRKASKWCLPQLSVWMDANTVCPHPLPGTEASQVGTQKWKADMSKKMATKRPKVAQSGKATPVKTVAKRSIVKVIHLKAKPGPKGMSAIELILAKPTRVSKFFCLSDVPPGSSQSRRDEGHFTVETIIKLDPHMITFDNLGDDSSLNVR
jgi:hypothetical protein